MKNTVKIFKKTALATAAILLTTGAMGQSSRDIVVESIPSNDASGLSLTLDIADGRDTVNIGDKVSFCFSASKAGYISMWDIGTSGKVSKIYPYKEGGNIRPVQANQRECIGNGRLRVAGPVGIEDVVLYWTADQQGQLDANEQYKSVKELAEGIQTHARDIVVEDNDNGWNNWATAKATFRIVEQGQSTTPNNPPSNTNGVRQTFNEYNNVYIVAVGSNVGELKKTNDDARLFAQLAQSSFGVPNTNIHFIENAKRQDIQDQFGWLANNAKENDLVFFFYSGHGAQIKDDNGDEADGLDEVIVPYDLNDPNNASNPAYFIRDDEIRVWLKNIKAGAVVTLFDACHSGGMYKGFSPASIINARSKLFTKGVAAVQPSRFNTKTTERDISVVDGLTRNGGTKYVMLSAAQEAQYALEKPGDGGLFTVALSSYLQSNEKMANWSEMMDILSRSVQRASGGQQEPKTEDPDKALTGFSFTTN